MNGALVRARPTSSCGQRARDVVWQAAWLWAPLTLLWLTIGLTGCRRPDPVYDRIPRPIGTRDLVRAERRARIVTHDLLSADEWQALWEIHDRYLEGFEAFRASELIPFAAQVRDLNVEELRTDERKLRGIVSRHLSIIGRIESMDDAFATEVAERLGEGRAAFVARLSARRAIDRASSLSLGDGGRPLLDLRQLVERLDLSETDWAAAETILSDFDTQASSIARSIIDEQATLPISHLAVIERRGPPSSSVDASLRGDARKRAYERAEWSRFAESRHDLEVLLERYAELVDRSVEGLSVAIGEEPAAILRRRLMQSRMDDDGARLGDPSAFQALVAASSTRVPKEVRGKIEAMRKEFLAADEGRLREILDAKRGAHQPGVFDPGGATMTDADRKERQTREEALVKARTAAAVRFREQVMELVGPEVAQEIEALREKNREEFANALAELVGSGRVPRLVQMRPRGFGDRDPPDASFGGERDGGSQDPGELRMLLPAAPDSRAIDALLTRSGVNASSRAVIDQVATEWRVRWDATRESARAKIRAAMVPVMEAMNQADERALDAAVQRMIGSIESLRSERESLDEELLASVDAAAAGEISEAARDLWLWERAEVHARLVWRDMPFDEVLRIPPEAQIAFLDILRRVPIPESEIGPRTALIASALGPFAEELPQATEALRDAALSAVRKAVVAVLQAKKKGMSESDALEPSKPETQRMMAPVRAAAERLATVRLEALDAVVAALPIGEGRALREQFVRAAYPRLLDERRNAEWALNRLALEPLLGESERAELSRINDERGRLRDAALDRLLDWVRGFRSQERPGREEMGNRDVTTRRHPELAAVLFAREEADARAIRSALNLLDSETLLRHREIAEFFNDPPATGRWLN